MGLASAFAWAAPGPLPSPNLSSLEFRSGAELVPPPDVIGFGPTGRIYLGGTFTTIDGQARPGIARLNADGTLDTAWSPSLPAEVMSPPFMAVEDAAGNVALAHARSGDEVVVYIPASSRSGLIVASEAENGWTAMAFDADGALYAAAAAKSCRDGTSVGGPETSTIRKFTSGAAADPAFSYTRGLVRVSSASSSHGTRDIFVKPCVFALHADGSFLYVGGWGVERAERATGAADASWQAVAPTHPDPYGFQYLLNPVRAIWSAAGDQIYLAGGFNQFSGGYEPSEKVPASLGRFSKTAPGAPDTTWIPSISGEIIGAQITGMAVDAAANHVYVAGYIHYAGGENRNGLAAFSTAPGAALVSTWDPNAPGARHLQLTDSALLVSFHPKAPEKLAALPLASEPVTWPVITVSPRSLDFGTAIEPITRTRAITIGNIGAGTLSLGTVTTSDPAFSAQHTCGAVAPGATCALVVTASLDIKFAAAARVTIESNGSGSPQTVALRTGLQDFGKGYVIENPTFQSFYGTPTIVGQARTITFSLLNQSSDSLLFDGAAVKWSGPAGELTTSSECFGAIAAGASCSISVTFAPKSLYSGDIAWLCASASVSGPCFQLFVRSGLTADDYDGDGLPNSLDPDPFVKSHDIFSDARLFAMQQYRDFLNREGDSGGITFWTNQIQGGAQSRAQCVESFFSSVEFQDTTSPVVRLYFAYFLRVPDYGGLQFWIDYRKSGHSLDEVSNHFAASPEFQGRYGALSNAAFVTLVYRNVLGRDPDAGGHAFWTQQLDSAARSRGQVMLEFSESAEYRAISRVDVYVTMMYVGMLRRSPDPGGFDFWTGDMDAGNSGLALIGGFLAAPEYRSRFLP